MKAQVQVLLPPFLDSRTRLILWAVFESFSLSVSVAIPTFVTTRSKK